VKSSAAKVRTAPKAKATDNAVEVRGISKVYQGSVHALDNINVDFPRGELTSLLGPSGCGKTTLLKIIAGLLPATSGGVLVNGRPVSGPGPERAFVFQDFALLPWATVMRNVAFGLELRGIAKDEREAVARRNIARVGLAGFEQKYPHELSGGMRQRVAIARALIHDAPLLLMDEPFGALDALTREQMRLDLEALWLATRKTVLFITHSIDEAVLLADRVVVMSPRPGRIERVLDVGLPRPRGLEARRSPVFTAAAEEITSIFLARGVLHKG
jgi:NitT/TauT family transport system ATP-binding protein